MRVFTKIIFDAKIQQLLKRKNFFHRKYSKNRPKFCVKNA